MSRRYMQAAQIIAPVLSAKAPGLRSPPYRSRSNLIQVWEPVMRFRISISASW